MYPQFLLLFALVLVSAVFSASETALIALTKTKVDDLVARKVPNAKLLQKMKKDPHRVLVTVLICNNVINIGSSAYAAVIFTEYFGSNGVGIATGVMTFLILVFGEIAPKAFAQEFAAGFALFIARFIYGVQLVLFPVIWIFDKLMIFINSLFGGKKGNTVTEGELVAMLKIGAQEGAIEKQERELIENVLEFNDIVVEEVMTPRVNIEALDSEMTIQEAVDYAIKHSHSRLPVYEKSVDNIVGIISIKELLKFFDECSPNKKLKNLSLSLPIEVPLTKKINKLFRELQRKHVHIAIVMDEYGGTAGLVTLEDLLEEIVGDIVDEFDIAEKPLEIVNKKTIIANGSTLIEDVNDFFKMRVSPNERDTLNTMIIEHLHRFPREGEVINFPRVRFTIQKMNRNLVEKVEIVKLRSKKKKK